MMNYGVFSLLFPLLVCASIKAEPPETAQSISLPIFFLPNKVVARCIRYMFTKYKDEGGE